MFVCVLPYALHVEGGEPWRERETEAGLPVGGAPPPQADKACRHARRHGPQTRPSCPQSVRVKTGRVCPQGLDQHRSDILRPSAQPSPSDPENEQRGDSDPVCWWMRSQPRKPSPGRGARGPRAWLPASRAQRRTLCLSHRAREERAEGEARARQAREPRSSALQLVRLTPPPPCVRTRESPWDPPALSSWLFPGAPGRV